MLWRYIVLPSDVPWVKDHVVQSNILYPAAESLTMAIDTRNQCQSTKNDNLSGYSLRETTIGHAVIIPQNTNKVETRTPLAILQWCI